MSERFLSEEDLDLANLSFEELCAWWELWLRQAQCSNDLDEHLYSHGVFTVEPGWRVGPEGVVRAEAEPAASGSPGTDDPEPADPATGARGSD